MNKKIVLNPVKTKGVWFLSIRSIMAGVWISELESIEKSGFFITSELIDLGSLEYGFFIIVINSENALVSIKNFSKLKSCTFENKIT